MTQDSGFDAGGSPLRLLRHPHLARVVHVFVPSALLLVGLSIWLSEGRVLPALLGVLYGFAWWTLLEYFLHRYVLHWEPEEAWARKLRRFMPGHRSHHNEPHDPDDVVSVKHSFAIPLAIIGLALLLPVFSWSFSLSTLAGAALGYTAYEYVHFACHQLPMKSGIGRRLRQHHGFHHYRDETVNFGVTSPFWDWVFGTLHRPGRAR
ncbi:MAG: sterol desaturase family protein [Pseudomonadota bacterium]